MPNKRRRRPITQIADLSQKILKILKGEPGKLFNHKQIAAKLKVE
jgi:hypothetical protein